MITAEHITRDGFVDLDRIPGTDTDKFRAAVAYFYEQRGRGIQGATWLEPKTIEDTVIVPAYFTLKAAAVHRNFGKEPNLIVNLNDPEKCAFFCTDRTQDGSGHYAAYQTFENVNAKAISPAKAILYGRNGSNQYYRNCWIDSNGLAQNGIIIGGGSEYSPRSTPSYIEKSKIVSAIGAGVFYDNCGNNHYITDSDIHKNGVGIEGTTFGTNITNTHIEKNDCAIRMYNSSRLELNAGYFENGVIELDNCHHLTMINVKHSGGEIRLKNVNSVLAQNCRLYGFPVRYEGNIHPHMEIKGCWFESERAFRNFQSSYRGDPVNVQGNFGDDWQQ